MQTETGIQGHAGIFGAAVGCMIHQVDNSYRRASLCH